MVDHNIALKLKEAVLKNIERMHLLTLTDTWMACFALKKRQIENDLCICNM